MVPHVASRGRSIPGGAAFAAGREVTVCTAGSPVDLLEMDKGNTMPRPNDADEVPPDHRFLLEP